MPRIRCTQRLLKLLGKDAVRAARKDDSEESDLDWYANLFYVEGRKCLMFVNAGTLFPVVALDVLKDDFRDPAAFLRERYREVLDYYGPPDKEIDRELALFEELEVGPTLDRSVIGSMNEYVALVKGMADYGATLGELSHVRTSASLSTMLMGGIGLSRPRDELAKRIPSLAGADPVRRGSATKDRQRPVGPSKTLARYLDHPTRRGKVYTYHEILGFMFHMIAAPNFVPPTAWIAELLGGEHVLLRNEREARSVLTEVFGEYNRISDDLIDLMGIDPRYTPLAEDPLDNFKEDAPVHQFARGFAFAHRKYPEVWEGLPDDVPDDVKNALQFAITVMLFFASETIGQMYMRDSGMAGAELADVAADIATGFYDAARLLTTVGLEFEEEQWDEDYESGDGAPAVPPAPAPPPKVGRNDPCPCGSGKKYKHCHGRSGVRSPGSGSEG